LTGGIYGTKVQAMTAKEADVRKRLSVAMVLIELASLAMMYLLIRLRPVPDPAGILLLSFLPIAFGAHVTEEFIVPGGFIAWDNNFRPQFRDTTGSYYVKVNVIPGIASILVVLGAFDYRGGYGAGVASWLVFSTFMSWNAVFHLRGAIRGRCYSPGMVTGLIFFVPLAVAGYVHFIANGALNRWVAILSAAAALAIQPILDRMKRRGQRKIA
jgi:Protein of unknown function with HXXEE motif